jgi:hypothetical protein
MVRVQVPVGIGGAAVNEEIEGLEKELAEVRGRMNAYLEELGLNWI